MTSTTLDATPASSAGPAGRLSAFLYRHPRLRLGGLLAPPLLWLVVAYLAALFALFITAFWSVDTFTGALSRQFTLENFQEVFTTAVYRNLTWQTLAVALTVTLISALVALPMGFYMAKVAGPRTRGLLLLAILTPLWASYLVKAYAWRGMVSPSGVLDWLLAPLGLTGPGFGVVAVILVETYLWLPYMLLATYAGFERLPNSLLEASSDLGAGNGRTFRSVVLPMVLPALVAGSIFTFSLTMGDYIAVGIVGGKFQTLGTAIYANVAGSANQPLGAALSMIPVAIITIYLLLVRRTGALSEL
jgi:putative spermidine/putrescine transport system permease protein